MRKIIDLSIAVEAGLPSDPPNQIPQIKYCNHKDTAAEMAGFLEMQLLKIFQKGMDGQ